MFNTAYRALKSFSRMFSTPDFTGVDLLGIDVCAIGRGYGCAARRIDRSDDLSGTLVQSFASAGPVVIEVLVDRTEAVLY